MSLAEAYNSEHSHVFAPCTHFGYVTEAELYRVLCISCTRPHAAAVCEIAVIFTVAVSHEIVHSLLTRRLYFLLASSLVLWLVHHPRSTSTSKV